MASHGDKYAERDRNSRSNKPIDHPPPCDHCIKDGHCKEICASFRCWEKTGV